VFGGGGGGLEEEEEEDLDSLFFDEAESPDFLRDSFLSPFMFGAEPVSAEYSDACQT